MGCDDAHTLELAVQTLNLGEGHHLYIEDGDVRPMFQNCRPQFFDGMSRMNCVKVVAKRGGQSANST